MTQEKRKKTQAELDEELKVKAPKTFELRQKIKEGAAPTLEARRRIAGGYHFGETTASKLAIDPSRRYAPATDEKPKEIKAHFQNVKDYDYYFANQTGGQTGLPPYRMRGLQAGLSPEEYEQKMGEIKQKVEFERFRDIGPDGEDVEIRDKPQITKLEAYLYGISDEPPPGQSVVRPSETPLISPFTGTETTAMIQKRKELEWFNETYPGIAGYGGERAAPSGGQNWWDLYGKYGPRVRTVDF